MSFQPTDPDFDERVRASFARQQVMRTLGIEIARLEPGAIELVMPFNVDYTQQDGFVHAGIITTALDGWTVRRAGPRREAGKDVDSVRRPRGIDLTALADEALRERVLREPLTVLTPRMREILLSANEEAAGADTITLAPNMSSWRFCSIRTPFRRN